MLPDTAALRVSQVLQHIRVARVGSPRRDLHVAQGPAVDDDGKCSCFIVAQAADPKEGAQVSGTFVTVTRTAAGGETHHGERVGVAAAALVGVLALVAGWLAFGRRDG